MSLIGCLIDMNKEYVNWALIYTGLQRIREQMITDNWIPDTVVGINRGGCIPGILLSHKLNVPHVPLDVRLRDHLDDERPSLELLYKLQGKKALIIDDINDTGATFDYIHSEFKDTNTFRYAAIYNNEPSSFDKVDYSAYNINKDKNPAWLVFPWEDWDKPGNFIQQGVRNESR
jgi:hypoxanthine phosphoribosyltransferase